MVRFILNVWFWVIIPGSFAAAQDFQAIEVLMFNADYEKAEAKIDQELAVIRNTENKFILENKKVEVYIRSGRFGDAEVLLKNLLRITTSASSKALTHTNFGFLYLNQGKNDLALSSLQTAMSAWEQDKKENSIDAAHTLSHLGNLYRATGKYTQASEQLNMALEIRQKNLDATNEWIAATYNDLGLIYSTSDQDKALDFYERALALYEKRHGKNHPKVAISATNTGFIYRDLELYGDAVNNFESALKIWETIYTQAHPTKAFILFNLGQTYAKMKDPKAALGYYEKALVMYESSYGKRHPDIANVLNALGNLKFESADFDASLSFYQKALIANVSTFENEDLLANPSVEDFYNGNTLVNSLLSKAQALEARHYGKTLKFSELALASKTLQSCDTLIDRLRQQIKNESDKITLGSIANEVYSNGVRIAYETSQVAFKKKEWQELSFYFAEKSKSAVLQDAIADANAKSFAGIPEELLAEEKNLKSAIALTAQKLADKPSAEEERVIREEAFNLKRTYASFTQKLEKEYPEYFNLKFNAAAPSIEQIQNKLTANTAVLSYFMDEKNSRLYIFQLTNNKFSIISKTLPENTDKYITGLRNSLYFSEIKTFKIAAHALGKLLLPKMSNRITSLVVLPTGRLSIVPFETLLTKEPTGIDTYAKMPYLLLKYSVQYEFSAGLLLQKSKGKESISAPSIFLCAPVTFPHEENLSDLPGSELEVNAIAELFDTKNLTNARFTQQQANKSLVSSSEVKKYSYLHFATHGIVDEINPELSRIYLHADSPAGNLFSGEIYNLQLNAELVTLSACQTGLGKLAKGEGVIGLSRALIYAGAKNIIVSFWSVADASTAELMQDFYAQQIASTKKDFSMNLRSAKLNMIKSQNYASPFYWAPFILIGF